MEYNSSIDAMKDAEFDQTAAEGACDVASLEPRGRTTLRRRSVGAPSAEVEWEDIGSDASGLGY